MIDVSQALGGISGILLTPFDGNGRINLASLKRITDRAIDAGVDNLVACGNTSEFYALDEQEALEHTREICAIVEKRTCVTAGVGRALPMAYRLLENAERSGADAIILHQPMEPFASPDGTVAYVEDIASRTSLPIMLYMRNDFFSAAEINGMLAPKNVLGVKYAVPDVLKFAAHVRQTHGSGKKWVCGLAEVYAAAFYVVGGRGFTSGLINVAPEISVGIRDALGAGDYTKAARLVDLISAFEVMRAKSFSGNNVTVVKEAVNMQGIPVGPARRPGTATLEEPERQRLREVLQAWAVEFPKVM